jgi:TonB family protein
VADRIVERAEAALLEERLDQAVTAVELVRNILPNHPRLPFLDSQLQRERERLQLTQARDVSVKLRATLQVLNQRLEAGRLITPSGQSARDALLEARRIDATDPGVIQGYRDLTNRLLTDAELALAAGQPDQAATLLAAARELSPSDARVGAIERSITDQTQTGSQSSSVAATPVGGNELALGRTRLAEGRLIEPPGDSARDHLLAARVANPNDPDVRRLLAELKDRLVESARLATSKDDLAGADKALVAAAALEARGNEDAFTAAQRELESRRADIEFQRNVISAGSLQRTRMVAPDYPEIARRRGVTGWVDLSFTVTTSGAVTDVTVMSSDPAEVFDSAAIQAVSGWRFKPVVRSGNAVPQRAAARIRFDIEN